MNQMICHGRSKGVFAVAVAGLFVLCGCHQTRYCWVLNDVDVTLPKMEGSERSLDRAGTAAELLAVKPGGHKTVLVTSLIKDNPDKLNDETAETFVAVLDAPLTVGVHELNADNCRLILNEVFRPCRAPYRGVEGKVEVYSIKEGQVRAKVVFREMIRWARAESHIVRDVFTFKPVVGDDVNLRQAGIDMGSRTGG
jgi:hypothetical protein